MKSEGQRRSIRQERRGERLHGGRRTPGSGAGVRKGDVRTPTEMIEYKYTGKRQVTIKAEVLEKLFNEAVAELRTPLLGLELNGKHYVVLPEHYYIEQRDGDGNTSHTGFTGGSR